jgi:hypothetical protein
MNGIHEVTGSIPVWSTNLQAVRSKRSKSPITQEQRFRDGHVWVHRQAQSGAAAFLETPTTIQPIAGRDDAQLLQQRCPVQQRREFLRLGGRASRGCDSGQAVCQSSANLLCSPAILGALSGSVNAWVVRRDNEFTPIRNTRPFAFRIARISRP